MKNKSKPWRYVQADGVRAGEHASDGYADFGSLDGLEAGVGRAETAAARIWAGAWSKAAEGDFRLTMRAADIAPPSGEETARLRQQAGVAGQPRGGLGEVVAQGTRGREVAELAQLARVQQRHTRALEKIRALVERMERKNVDAAVEQPFEFGP